MMNLTYNLASGTWLTPTGTAGTDWTPELNFGEAPDLTITIQGLPQGIALATAWQVAVAKDWQSTTSPMCRTTDGITCTIGDDTAVFSFAVDTATERFLRVVDGKGEGVYCSMQIVGISDGTPCCFVTMPWLCRPALDPHGSAGPLPPIPTTNMTEAEVEAIAEQAAEDIAESASLTTTTTRPPRMTCWTGKQTSWMARFLLRNCLKPAHPRLAVLRSILLLALLYLTMPPITTQSRFPDHRRTR